MYAYPYSSNPAWADVTPVPEPEFSPPVVRIVGPPDFTEAMSYFRAILRSDERSERAISLTADVIVHNVANYSAWQHRFKCLIALSRDLFPELDFVAELSVTRAKCYQIWQHRRAVCAAIGRAAAEREIASTAKYLENDTKNYHCWSYRQWLLRSFATLDVLLDEVRWSAAQLVLLDCRNNSQWNQRHFLLTRCFPGALSHPTIVAAEVRFTLSMIQKVALNESAWVYLDTLIRSPGFRDWYLVAHAALRASAHPPLGLSLDPRVPATRSPPVAVEGGSPCNRFAHSSLLELLLDPRCPPLDLLALAGAAGEAVVAAAEAVGKAAAEAAGQGAVIEGVDIATTAAAIQDALPAASKEAASQAEDGSPKGKASPVSFPIPACKGEGSALAPAEGAECLALLSRAAEQCEILVGGDPVRAKYWRYRLAQVEAIAEAERAVYTAAPPTAVPADTATAAAAAARKSRAKAAGAGGHEAESEDSEEGESDLESGVDEDDLAAAAAAADAAAADGATDGAAARGDGAA